jgi:glycosyltransferase involved in cell wall biosynthesis
MKKLLTVNNYHYRRGGADSVFLDHSRLFSQMGWKVVPFSMQHPNNFKSPYEKYFISEIEFGKKYTLIEKIINSLSIIYSFEAKRHIINLLEEENFDICHCHNIYHHISPSILPIVKSYAIPIVMTLHDLKLCCPNYQMLTHDGICERCKKRKYFNTIKHKCIKSSLSLSILIAIESYVHQLTKIYYRNVDRFIVPSKFYIKKMEEWGMPGSKMSYIPNYVDATQDIPEFAPGKNFLYFGRLSQQKGLKTLVKAAKKAGIGLLIAGEGPEKEDLLRLVRKLECNVTFLGFLNGKKLKDAIRSCRASILPSEWYENAPMSIKESYAFGKPVIGADIGGIPELISNEVTGFTFKSGSVEQLADRLRNIADMKDSGIRAMGKEGRSFVEKHHNKKLYIERVKNLYLELTG